MSAIDLIREDLGRAGRRPRWVEWGLVAGVALGPMALGVFLRDSYDGVLEPMVFLPNLAAAILLAGAGAASFRRNYDGERLYRLCLVALAGALVLSVDRVIFPSGARTRYASSLVFWIEASRCFWKGSIVALVFGSWLSLFAFRFAAWPRRGWRGLIAVATGVSATVMLGFHCDSSSAVHVGLGHLGPGILIGVVVYHAQKWLFAWGIRRRLPGRFQSVGRLDKLF